MLLNCFCLVLCVGVVGCGGKVVKPGDFIGDPAQPARATLVVTDAVHDVLVAVGAGDGVPLEPPPQGGYVIYAGVRAVNLLRTAVVVRGQLRDPTDGASIGFDARTVDLVLQPDGWAAPRARDPSSFANIAACPDYRARDIQDQTYTLEVTLIDRQGRTATASQPVIPRCLLDDPRLRQHCVCTCSRNYFLGRCTFADGGT